MAAVGAAEIGKKRVHLARCNLLAHERADVGVCDEDSDRDDCQSEEDRIQDRGQEKDAKREKVGPQNTINAHCTCECTQERVDTDHRGRQTCRLPATSLFVLARQLRPPRSVVFRRIRRLLSGQEIEPARWPGSRRGPVRRRELARRVKVRQRRCHSVRVGQPRWRYARTGSLLLVKGSVYTWTSDLRIQHDDRRWSHPTESMSPDAR